MKVILELEADKDKYTATLNDGTILKSDDTGSHALRALWLKILDAKIYTGDNDELDIYCGEEYSPEWPLSIAGILKIEEDFSRDMYYEVIDW